MRKVKVSIAIDLQKNRELTISDKIVVSHALQLITDCVDASKLNWIQFEFETDEKE